jgi:myogenesis-regulating glycosidase
VLKGRLWRTRPNGRLPYDCSKSMSPSGNGLCLIWKKLQLLNIEHYSMNNATCHDVRWKALDKSVRHMDCYNLESAGHWYGAGLMSVQLWPLERTTFNKQPFVTGTFHDRNCFGSVVERYWLTSSGVAITVADNLPLYVSINSRPIDEHGSPTSNVTDHQLCLYADNTPALNYTICVGNNVRHVHESMAKVFGDETSYTRLPESFLTRPVWSTWSLHKDNYNQSSLIKFAQKIKSSKLHKDGGLLMIDDGWEERYGDMKYNSVKFDDPLNMINDLHADGFQVSETFCLNRHPYLSHTTMISAYFQST